MSLVMGRMERIWDNMIEAGLDRLQRLETNVQKHRVGQSKADDTSRYVLKMREAECNNAVDVACIQARQTVDCADKKLPPSHSDWLVISILDR